MQNPSFAIDEILPPSVHDLFYPRKTFWQGRILCSRYAHLYSTKTYYRPLLGWCHYFELRPHNTVSCLLLQKHIFCIQPVGDWEYLFECCCIRRTNSIWQISYILKELVPGHKKYENQEVESLWNDCQSVCVNKVLRN